MERAMTSQNGRWRDGELPEPVMHALSTSEGRAADDAAIARMHARLEAALGAAFDAQVDRPLGARSAPQLRRVGWFGAGAIVAASIAVWSLRPGAPEPPLPATRLVEIQHEQALPVAQPSAPDGDTTPSAPQLQPAAPKPRAAPAPIRQSKPAANGVKTATTSTESGLAEELSGLEQIRALMTKSPERALAAAEQQQQQFPRGALQPERALLRLDALLRLERAFEAQQLAQQLLAAPANQPYRARIVRLLQRPAAHD
jgi:hypothetical protein